MWPFSKSSPKPTSDELAYWMKQYASLEERLEQLEVAHKALRGRVYYARLHKNPLPDSPEEQTATLTKDQLRKIAGIKPGQPYNHKE